MNTTKTLNTITSEIITLTPELATELLKNNTLNRPLSRSTVLRYEVMIRRGEWMTNGEPIIVFSDGTLGDGQHRCEAVRRTGISIQSLLVRGVERTAFSTLNQGKSRTASDVLAINCHRNYVKLGSAARAYLIEECGRKSFSNIEIINCIENHPAIGYWVKRNTSGIGKKLPSMLPAYLALASERFGSERLESFFDQIVDGVNLNRTDPAYVLRERLLREKKSSVATEIATRAYIIKAINAHLLGEEIKQLRYKDNETVEMIWSIRGRGK